MAFRKLTVRWSLASEDTRQTSWFFNTGGNADQEAAIEAAFDTAWASLKSRWHPNTGLDEYRWYFALNIVPRGEEWGDADRLIDRAVAGTAAGSQLPPQLSVVVTYPRPAPHKRHPGRNYLPAPASGALDANGRVANATCDAIADWMESFLEAAVAVGYQPVTIVKIEGVDSALIIPDVRVDNTFDTQRRRGFETYTYAASRSLTTVP